MLRLGMALLVASIDVIILGSPVKGWADTVGRLQFSLSLSIICMCVYIYIYMYISRPWGDRKFGGCLFWGCLGGDFGKSVLKERRSERARLD